MLSLTTNKWKIDFSSREFFFLEMNLSFSAVFCFIDTAHRGSKRCLKRLQCNTFDFFRLVFQITVAVNIYVFGE